MTEWGLTAGPGSVPPTQRCRLEALQHLTAAMLGGASWGHEYRLLESYSSVG